MKMYVLKHLLNSSVFILFSMNEYGFIVKPSEICDETKGMEFCIDFFTLFIIGRLPSLPSFITSSILMSSGTRYIY